MREIKFKAWDRKHKEMCKVLDVDFDLCWVGILTPDKTKVREKLENVELIQYTGLKDKNKREIYEGYIVRTIDKNYNVEHFEVAYYKSAFALRNKNGHKEYLCNLACFDCLEIIGNIYENPELLENIK